MSHFAIVAPALFSHIRALESLAHCLMARGHRITLIQQAEASTLLSDGRINFHAVGRRTHPPGSLARTLERVAHPAGTGILRLIDDLAMTTDMLCRTLPEAVRQLRVEGLIVDQMEPAGALIATAMKLPFVSIACALPVNREEGLPLPVMPFAYATHPRYRKLYAASARVYDWMMRRHSSVLAAHARTFGLQERRGLHDWLSPLAQISQTLDGFDLPRRTTPGWFHAVGPLRHKPLPAPLTDTDNLRPLVFASLGSLQGHRYRLFRTITRACRKADVTLLLAHCGGLSASQEEKLTTHGARVTDFTDQRAVLRRAQAVITHGGLNTVMDAIESMTPLLTIPLAFDQPGIAARVIYSGIGRRTSRFAGSTALAGHLHQLLHNNVYRQRLALLQPQLRQAGGAALAAAITERALITGQPVMRGSL